MTANYKQQIVELIDKQMNKGLETYGMPLEANQSLSFSDRCDYLAEELVDGLQYISHLKAADQYNEKHKEDIAAAVGSAIYLIANIKDETTSQKMMDNMRVINSALKAMI